MIEVLCLRPETDFRNVGVIPPEKLSIQYRSPGDPDVKNLLKTASALVLPSAGPHLENDIFEEVTNLRLVQYTGAGWDRIAESTLRRINCLVANVPGVNAIDVAEYSILAAGTLLRKMKLGGHLMFNGNYIQARSELAAENVRGFRGLTTGVVGLGHIGLTVGKLFRLLGSEVVYYDPATRYREEANQAGLREMSLDNLLSVSDVITLHVPLLPQTQGLLGEREISLLKPDAIVVQASRGGVVDEEALLRSLQTGAIGGVALDVFSTEPLPPDAPLLKLAQTMQDRILMTPHIAGVTRQAAAKLYAISWANVEGLLLHEKSPTNLLLG